MNSEKRIDGDKDGEERDFRHFRMQKLDCVNSKSRIGSGEREIQLAQFRMQDFDSKSKKSSMDERRENEQGEVGRSKDEC